MADVQPLRALHYDLAKVGPLADLDLAPLRRDRRPGAGGARRPLAVQRRRDRPAGGRRGPLRARGRAVRALAGRRRRGARRRAGAVGTRAALPADRPSRRGFFARVRVEEYGPGRIRPHERTHPGPKEDRLRLTRATAANLSPIFSLYSDPAGAALAALAPARRAPPWGEATDADGTRHRLWRCGDPAAIEAVASGARRRRAADRRRPPPLRDRARLRRGDRRRGRSPLRADVPGRARGPRPRRSSRRTAWCAASTRRSSAALDAAIERDFEARRRRRASSRRRRGGVRSRSATSTRAALAAR